MVEAEQPVEEPVEKPRLGKVIASYLTRIIVREVTPDAAPPTLAVLDSTIQKAVEDLGYTSGDESFTVSVESERLDK